MQHQIDATHDPELRSWVESANDPDGDFPIQNLPLCAFKAEATSPRAAGVRIGDSILVLDRLLEMGVLDDLLPDSLSRKGIQASVRDIGFGRSFLDVIAAGAGAVSAVRTRVSRLLTRGSSEATTYPIAERALVRASEVDLLVPLQIGDYSDFYASVHHATTVGTMFRPDQPLLPNYKHIPIGYHGRASSIVPSGTHVKRPKGQQAPPDADPSAKPNFAPSAMLDYELEVGAFVGRGNRAGETIPIDAAEDSIIGLCLLNDWSARDIQRWEYQPLGPFLAKNFATSISPYIITLDALAPFRTPLTPRPASDPAPLPYLTQDPSRPPGGFDITLEVYLQSAQMEERSIPALPISRGSFKDMYWTFAQMLTHHASNGCRMRTGDLLGSGTASGPTPESRGCLLELTFDGLDPATRKPRPRKPIQLPTGETRTFLADGDTVTFKAYCQAPGRARIGFGECSGKILPA
jgi:fumarylacetoacetase